MKDFETPAERRWSELVPPHTALTFAAIWDDEQGMVTFSGAHLLDSCNDKGHHTSSPYDVADGQSQILTIDRLALGYPNPSAGLDSLAYARDALVDAETAMDSRSCLGFSNAGGLRVPPGIPAVPDSPAAASSMALASLINTPFRKSVMKDLVERGKQAYQMRSRQPDVQVHHQHDICPYDLKYMEPTPRPQSAGSKTVTDEGFFEDHRLTRNTFGTAPVLVDMNLSSAFSVTTTSTSRYIEVDHPPTEESLPPPRAPRPQSQHESTWTTIRDVQRDICFNVPLEVGRRLRKPRTSQARSPHSHQSSQTSSTLRPSSASPSGTSNPSSPADPREVLARRHYNHMHSPEPATPSSWRSKVTSESSMDVIAPALPSGSSGHRASLRRTKELLHRVVGCKRGNEDDYWVCVEVQHKVKQRVCAVDL
ncbi:hypothetical protein C8Q79DRAFT_926603 [Trametes meyenii]|nr:hypothetical protein C8Q79DRAFT_926603 [Trametes meyenii]